MIEQEQVKGLRKQDIKLFQLLTCQKRKEGNPVQTDSGWTSIAQFRDRYLILEMAKQNQSKQITKQDEEALKCPEYRNELLKTHIIMKIREQIDKRTAKKQSGALPEESESLPIDY